jgi:nucleotide-binding universal stress UspA family protein
VVEPPRYLDGGVAPTYVPTLEELETVRSSFGRIVSEQMRRCAVGGALQMRSGPPDMEIAMAATEMNAELIVLGLGQHGIVERALGNETALQLVQIANVPVLAVPAGMTSLPRRVLAGTDFAPTSIASIKATAQWLTNGDVLHIVYVAGEWHGGYPLEQRARAESLLTALAQRFELPKGVALELNVVEGDPSRRIMQLATTTVADMIVLGSHGYGFWKRLTIGSVASKTVRLSHLAVYVTPIGCIGEEHAAAAAVSVSASRAWNQVS